MIKNAALLLVSTIISLVFVEVMLRQTNIGISSLNHRVLFYSPHAFVISKSGAIKYRAKTDIRLSAVYGNLVEIDLYYPTNNLGFIDPQNYGPEETGRAVGFVGDSFTAGSGGTFSWVNRLRSLSDKQNTKLYNLGIAGTGALHFEDILEDFHQSLDLDEINIMVISNDFFREKWRPVERKEGLWFCLPDTTDDNCIDARPPLINLSSPRETKDSLTLRAKEIYTSRQTDKDSARHFYQRLRLHDLSCQAISKMGLRQSVFRMCPQIREYRKRVIDKTDLYWASIQAIERILVAYPEARLRVFHIPEKQEVSTKRYSLDLRSDMKARNIEYIPLLKVCKWDKDMFHRYDGHPQDSGYENLAQCMAKFLN